MPPFYHNHRIFRRDGRSRKVDALSRLVREDGGTVETICEVGFNAGHSALIWLLNTPPSTRVVSFDLGQHVYVRHAVEFLKAVFPGRLEMVFGDSKDTIPAYTRREVLSGRDPRICNVILIDGDHSEKGAYTDLSSFEALASRRWNKLVLDDMDLIPVTSAWQHFRAESRAHLNDVIQARGQYFTKLGDPDIEGNMEVEQDSTEYQNFVKHGFFSMGLGTYHIVEDSAERPIITGTSI